MFDELIKRSMHDPIKVSVIIPMYNSEKYLRECLNSILEQVLSQNYIEIICIDDGSTDSTLDICKEYIELYKNIFLLENTHKGVSHARNKGIEHAKGKYIAFLDSDDMFCPNTLDSLINFFDKYYENVDIITYKISYLRNKKTTYNKRDTLVKESKIIDLNEYPHICQTTMNIMVKNESKILFDENLTLLEDQTYILHHCMQKKSIGYVKEAEYIYRRDEITASSQTHPYYSFDDFIVIINSWLKEFTSEKFYQYTQCLILYNFAWRIRSDMFLPYNEEKNKNIKAIESIRNILNKIDNKLIISSPWLTQPHQEYLLNLKSLNRPFSIISPRHWFLCDDNGHLWKGDKFLNVISIIKIQDNNLLINGYIKSYISNFHNNIEVLAVINDDYEIKCESCISSYSMFWSKMVTNNYVGYNFCISIDTLKKIFFYIKIGEYRFPVSYWFSDGNQISTANKSNVLYYKNKYLVFNNQALFLYNIKNEIIIKKEQNKLRKKQYRGIKFLKIIAKHYFSKKRIWLYNDFNSLNNAYYQFKNDINKNDNINRYYIYNTDIDNFTKDIFPSERIFFIKYGSKLHRMLFLNAELIITSFSEQYTFNPFGNKTNLILDSLHSKIIYIQHGIMHAKLPYLYAKERNPMIDKIVVSTFMEYKIAKEDLHFTENDIITTGMPRLDIIKLDQKAKNKIIFIPSWRRYLVSLKKDSHSCSWSPNNIFTESKYFLSISNIIQDEIINKLLTNYKVQLDIKLHPNMKEYISYFPSSNNIKFCNDINISDYKLCITDFSSLLYDFIYANKPIIIFIPDFDLIIGGLHSYREFYIDIKNSIGDFTINTQELFQIIEGYILSNFAIKKKYSNIYSNFFISKQSNHRNLLYNKLINLSF